MDREDIESLGFKFDSDEKSCMAFVSGIWDLWYYPETHRVVIESEETGVIFDGVMKTKEDLVMFIVKYNNEATAPSTEYNNKLLGGYKKIESLSFDDWVKWRTKKLSLEDVPDQSQLKGPTLTWVTIVEGDINTYPKEGYSVLVSDGEHHDVAWYLMSGSYKWVKTDVLGDCLNDFEAFEIKKWAYFE